MSDLPHEQFARTAKQCHEDGVEVTPDEVEEVVKKMLAGVRLAAAERGLKLPKSDHNLLVWIKAMQELEEGK